MAKVLHRKKVYFAGVCDRDEVGFTNETLKTTKEIYDNLKTFVEKGGRLFMMTAHLNTSNQRDGSIRLINGGDVSDLFGCTLDVQNIICK